MATGPAKTRNAKVISHWPKHFETFITPPSEFYTSVEAAFATKGIPEVEVSRVTYKESSFLSADREYLRLERKKYIYDICAAPFGNGFFFSSWLVMLPPALTIFHLCGMAATVFILLFLFTTLFGFFKGIFLLVLGLGVLFYLLRSGTIQTGTEIEQTLLGMTLIGAFYDVFRREPTYFEIDTALMFQSVVHSSVMEVMDSLTDAKGIPRLTELERKPIMREFFQR
ncbi:hypothetical protein HS121_01850 [bacterium]|nr:hypothetical protein [bacterium]